MSLDQTNPYAAPPIPADDGLLPLSTPEVKALLRRPAIGLLASSVWGIAIAVFLAILQATEKIQQLPKFTAQDRSELLTGLCMLLAFVWVACYIFRGGLAMLRADDIHQARHGAFLAMLPCGGAWIIGLPFGIWAWSVLRDPRVKQEFLRNRRRRSQIFPTMRSTGEKSSAAEQPFEKPGELTGP